MLLEQYQKKHYAYVLACKHKMDLPYMSEDKSKWDCDSLLYTLRGVRKFQDKDLHISN